MTLAEAEISEVLNEAAEQASVADSLVARLLDAQEQPHRRAAPPWPAMAKSAVVVLTVAMLGLAVLQRDPRTGPSSSQSSLTNSQTSARPLVPPGYVDLHAKGVHVALDERGAAARDPWRSWQLPCRDSLLAPARSRLSRHTACAGRPDDYPLWEVLVAPTSSHPTFQPRRFTWSTPISRSVASIGLPPTEDAVLDRAALLTHGRHRVEVALTTVRGMARYPCASDDSVHLAGGGGMARFSCPGGGWVHRTWTTIYFTDRKVRVSILAPSRAAIAWLTSTIYVD